MHMFTHSTWLARVIQGGKYQGTVVYYQHLHEHEILVLVLRRSKWLAQTMVFVIDNILYINKVGILRSI
jgi:hypothetical protein